MILSDQKIQHVSTITHDGKVVCFGTALDGTIWFTVKRSGFEDTALNDDTDPFGFEGWKKLRLGESVTDPSVIDSEKKTLSDASGNVLVKSVYGDSAEVTKSTDAPVQVVSALNQLFVFRQSPSGKILVNRFVLDGMTNEIVPKLEVRFRRSKQRLKPQESATSKDGGSFDNLDYRDINGNNFYEGALELSFAGTVANGWFSPVFVPTAESDRHRWHLFVYDATDKKLVLYTVGSGDNGLFDVKDHLYGHRDPSHPKNTIYESIPGIIRRTIDLTGLTVAGGPSATTYDLQKEVITDAGPQLMRDTMRVMLALPVKATSSEVVKTAVIDFALAADGTLSQIDHTPDKSDILRSEPREVITPLALFDDIKEIADTSPPPSGTIVATERGGDDKLQIRSKDSLPADLKTGAKVKIRGTKSYDGHYKVLSVKDATFQVAATFEKNEAGFWEVVPDKQTGLVFDNMVVGSEKAADDKLMILCAAHDLKVGDEVQISGTQEYDGIFPVASIVASKKAFVLNAPYFTGEAANLSKVVRRGLRMDGNDWVETPDLEFLPPSPEQDLSRTFSAWVRVDAAGNLEQSLVKDSGGMMDLALGSDNKVKLVVRMSDGVAQTVTDPNAMPVDAWVHYAGTVDYVTKTGGDTRIALCRDGVEVVQKAVARGVPCHLNDKVLQFDGVDDRVEITTSPPNIANKSFSIEIWVKRDRINVLEFPIAQGTLSANMCVHMGFRANNVFTFGFWGNDLDTPSASAYTDLGWHHWACTYDATTYTRRIYRDGELIIKGVTTAHFQGSGTWTIGRTGGSSYPFKGKIADVRVWNRVRTEAEIAEDMARRLTDREAGLLGHWPLDDGTGSTVKDMSPTKRHGTLTGAIWQESAFFHPQIELPPSPGAKLAKAMKFDGVADFIEVPKGAALITDKFTVAAWVKVTGGKGRYRSPLTCRGGDFTGIMIYATDSNKWQCRVGSGSAWGYLEGPAVVEGIWTHLALSFDGTKWNLYVNRSLAVSLTAAYKPTTQPMRIGAGATEGNPDFYFHGCIADMQIWSSARSLADIQADMSKKPTGKETGLAGYFPLDADASDLSPNKRESLLKGKPALVSAGLTHTIGQTFSGEISGVQIWDEARSAADVKATMHLNLSGKETGLSAYYRMGAIVYEEQPPIIPDFSRHGRNAVVYGDPYAGARRLNRKTGSGMKVVKYGSEELVAVSQRGVYEESFEFKVTSPNTAFDPKNADGTGLKLFAFSYFGKSSRGSKEKKEFPAGSVQESDFASLSGGWYKATCKVVVPDGVSLMRAFEISDVRGTWKTESAAPATEWTSIDVRKHRIRLISDTVTRDSYTDVTALSSLPAQAQTVLDNLATMGRAEAKVGRIEGQIRDLTERIDVAKNNQRYVNEKNTLTTKLSNLQSQKTTAQNARTEITSDPYSYYHKLRVKHSQQVADVREGFLSQYSSGKGGDTQLFRLQSLGNGWFNIFSKAIDGYPLTATRDDDRISHYTPSSDYPESLRSTVATLQNWRFVDLGGGYNYIKCGNGRVMDVRRGWHDEGTQVLHYEENRADNQRWAKDKTSELTKSALDAIAEKNKLIVSLDAQIASTQQRLNWLTEVLAANESLAALQSQLTAAQTDLKASRTDLGTKNTAVIDGLTEVKAATMPAIATDDRDLVTAGAVLDFAQPMGKVRLAESCEGNVLLTYFDPQGRMRATAYDAAADSRNAAFEQWLPDAVRACADIRESSDKVTLEKAVSLHANGWTCEAWVQYPLATKSDDDESNGTAYGKNVVASADTTLDAPLMVRKGSRLGLMVDGWFFDSGVDLEQTIAAGWHHVAVATSRGTTAFYADGAKIGSRKTSQPAIRLNGTADYVEVPAHANPTTAITVSIWARSATSNWNGAGFLVSKRDAFLMSPVKDSQQIQFYIYVSGQGWKSVSFTPADIQGWHLYTGTFDGNYICLYIDGEFAAELAVTGAIQADSGPLYIGYDDGNTAYFKGDIAEVSIWKSARPFSDVREDIYRSFNGDEADLIGYWRMDDVEEGDVLKVKDLTSNKRDGLVKGAPADATITTMRTMDIKVLGNASSGGSPVGRLAEVRLWNLGLTDAEVAAHARVSISGNEPGLLGYWPFDEGTGTTASDGSAGGQAHGSMVGVDWMGRTANLGNPGGKVLNLPDWGSAYVQCPAVALASKSFTFECWARRSGANVGKSQVIASMGSQNTNQGFHFGFRDTNKFTLAFYSNDVDSPSAYTDTDWHHWCGTYDQPTKKQRIYCDGVMVAERTATADFTGSGTLSIGKAVSGGDYFMGDLAEVRIWDRVRTDTEILTNMRRRVAGTEANLLAYYPLDEVNGDNKVKDKKAGVYQGELKGSAELLLTTSSPVAGAESLITAEYSSIEVSGEGKKQALMRRFFGFTTGGDVQLLPEQRVEELTLQWVGNTQINPTLLGYIEGAPPIPSENLTVDEDYNGATTVTLRQSEETSYSWQRSETTHGAFNMDGFLGAAWETSIGLVAETKATEGQAGGVFNYSFEKRGTKDTSVTAASTLAMTDSLELSGMAEDKASCPLVGKRWVPKNVGYALVISGMADVFVTKLKRSGRMVSYDIRPVEGVPLDVNTITFLINPAYTLNGSLDGMVGSVPADPTFYPHVPEMRSQYGSLYPASYFRLKQAYALKDAIERHDKERESFFYNFSADQIDHLEAFSDPDAPSVPEGDTQGSPKATEDDVDAMLEQNEEKKKDLKSEGEKRKAEIKGKYKSLEKRVRAGAAFDDWQLRMENIQTKAGKRNIVNTYVWDGDGGLRAEEQSFAGTIEHSISTETSHSGGGGGNADASIANFKFSLSLVGSGGKADAHSKTLSTSKSLELGVDLSGVEKRGITDPGDNPLVPGEKVDRYRFMSFYLEGSTDHFTDFFSHVVDPEWLMSNDEEARALRQAQAAKPNKCWRVLHRVTYVERPVLMGFGRDTRVLSMGNADEAVTDYFADLERKQQALDVRLGGMEDKLAAIVAKLGA
jgi:hypothetical protein